MDEEWNAWQLIVDQWPEGKDINHPDSSPLVNAIRYWGETLVALRITQDKETVSSLLEDARQHL